MNNEYLHQGRQALAIGAWEEALELIKKAVESGDESPAALEDLACASWWLNDIPSVFTLREKAYSFYLEKKDNRGASRMASLLGLDYLEFQGAFAIANGWFERADHLLEGEGECAELAMIRTLKANLVFRVNKDAFGAVEMLSNTIALCKSLNDTRSLMLAEGLKGFILVTVGNVSEGMRLLDEAAILALNEEVNDIHAVTTTCCFVIDACQRVRDYERAGQWCTKVREICLRWRHRAVFATCRVQYANVLISKGEWQDAEEELLAAEKELKRFKPPALNSCLTRLAGLERLRGNLEKSQELLDQVSSYWLKPLVQAELAYDREHVEEARALAEKFLRQIPPDEQTERVAGLEILLRTLLVLGQIVEAESALREISGIAENIDTPMFHAAHLNAKGMFLLAGRDPDEARKSFEDAIAQYEEMRSPYEAFQAHASLAAALEESGLYGRAIEELSVALQGFENLGAGKDAEKTIARIRNISAKESAPDKFTRREVSVLRLIAEGRNNEEIACRLFVSERTVEKHLSNIYQKLGVSGKSARAFAASYAARNLANHPW